MSENKKAIVRDFYSEFPAIEKYLHPDTLLYWNSSSGFQRMDADDITKMATELARAFHSLRLECSHLMVDGDFVTIRFTYFVKTIENEEEELPMAHFIAIWEVKEGKLYRGHQISQQANDSPENLSSFLPIY